MTAYVSSPLEQAALAFARRIQTDWLERRDLPAILSGMTPDIFWVGSGRGESCSGLQEAQASLARELQEYPGRFCAVDSDYRAKALSEDICVVCGTVAAQAEAPEVADLDIRVTAVCVRTGEGMRLAHLHLSHPDTDQEAGRYYVKREAALDRAALRERADEALAALRERDRELTELTENIPGGIHQCRYDKDFTLISVTSGFLALIGYTREELRERFHDRFAELMLPEARSAAWTAIREQLSRGDTIELEYPVRRKDGSVMWILDKGRLTRLVDGTGTFYCMSVDNTANRRDREELRLSLERYRIITDQATDIIFEWDIRKDTLLFSSNWRKKFGYEAISRDISKHIPFSDNIHPEDMPAFVKIMEDTAAGVPYSEAEFRIRDVWGNFTWGRIRATTQYDGSGTPIKAVGVILDIDEDKKQRQQLMDLAQRDGLTGLLNKAAARPAVEACLDGRDSGPGALLIIDLDSFKQVNDRYGHLAGDAVLTDLAAILKRLARDRDVVARIGGDEFLVYLPGTSAAEAERKARAVIQAMAGTKVLGRRGQVSCSVGAAVYPDDADSFAELYRSADLALYQVKSEGKRGFAFFSRRLERQGLDGRVVRSTVSSVIDSDAGLVNEKLGQYCFRMLYRAIEPVAAVHQILEIVGRAYDVSRVYIFESSEDGQCCSNTFEWCGEGVAPERDNLQGLSYREDLGDYLENFDADGVFYCGDVGELKPVLRGVLEPQGIRSMLQCAVVDDGQFRGYVGFDECRENRRWTRAQIETLTLVSNVLSTFLMKLRYKERLARLEEERGG